MSTAERMQVILNHLEVHKKKCNEFPSRQLFARSTAARKYVYTLDNNLLTSDQRTFYEGNGYLVIRKLIEDEVLDECRQRFVDLCQGRVDKGYMLLMKDKSLMKTDVQGEYLYNKVQDIVWEEVFSKYILHPKIIKYVECFAGSNCSAIHSMLINKPPDSGKLTSIHPLHQDLHYFPFRPADKIVASWTAMESVTVQNGCLFVIPGTHKSSLQPHDYPEMDVNGAFHGVKGFDLVPRLNLEMEKGDTVFFHPLLMHGSGPNLTKGFRKAISCHYASNDCYFIDVEGTTQENIAKEVEEVMMRRGIRLKYNEFWKLRQRIIAGPPGALN